MEHVSQEKGHFCLILQDGRRFLATHVIVATGMHAYAYYPPLYMSLPRVSHSSDHADFSSFKGLRVAVVGGGQSAIETAALVYESGATVSLVTRKAIEWLVPGGSKIGMTHHRPLWYRLRYPYARLSPGWFNWWLEHFPYMFYWLPGWLKDAIMQSKRGGYRAAATPDLRRRIEGNVALYENCNVQQVEDKGTHIVLSLSNGKTLEVEHVILGTGYQVDIDRLSFLAPELRRSIKTYQGSPVLNKNFESSVPGFYFVGLAAVSSFGPLYRFVIGVDATARRITRAIGQR